MSYQYRREFDSYSSEVPWTMGRVIVICFMLIVGITSLGLIGCAVGLFSGAAHNAATVIQKEFYPDALLRKYEWFKDASAALDKKVADIEVYDKRLKDLSNAYVGVPRRGWARDDREQYSIISAELSGIKASYNSLASEYNAEMAKFNWRFANVGEVPQGGKPVPHDYRPYLEQ